MIATFVVAICTFVVKLVAAGKDLVLANFFGISASLDTFLLAYLVPSVAVNILAGSLQAAFVPKYVLARSSDGDAAAAEFASATATMLALSLALTTILVIPIVAWGIPAMAGKLPAQHVEEARWMAVALTPVIVLNGLTFFWSGFLNTHDKFAIPALTPIVTPICIAVAALQAAHQGVHVLVIGALIGACIELSIVLAHAHSAGQRLLFAWPRITTRHREMLKQFGAAASGNFVLGATMIIDQSFAASTGAGGVATLNFGVKLTQVIAGILAMAIGTAVLPNASRLVAKQDWVGLRMTLKSYTKILFAITLPITGALILFSEDIVRVVFQRGAFDASDTNSVAFVQSLSALQIPFFAFSILIVRTLSAISANVVLLVGAVISLLLDVVLNYSLVPLLGVAGTGLSTSLMYAVSCVFLVVSLHIRLRRLEVRTCEGSASGGSGS